MKNKIVKYVLNSVILAAVAAVGIAAYQIGTTPTQENKQQDNEATKEYAMLDDIEEDNNGEYSLDETDAPELSDEELNEVGSIDVEAIETEDLEDSKNDQMETMEETSVENEWIDIEVPEDFETVDTSSKNILEQLSFSEATQMQWPVSGEILLDYDMTQTIYYPTLDQYRLSSAVAVEANVGEPVEAAATGMVYSIKQDAKTGTTVTMELGDGYQAIYGQLENLTVEEGDKVEQGTIIGYVSAPTKYYSVEGSNLYFAMKQNGEPVNPVDYLP